MDNDDIHGKRVVRQRDDTARDEKARDGRDLPDYGPILRITDPDAADRWHWGWRGPDEVALE